MNGSAALHTGDVSNPFWQGLADTEFVSTFCKPVGFEHLDQLEIGTLTPCFEEVIILGTIHGLTLVLSLVHVARLSCGARVAHAQISSRKWQRIKACLVAVSALIPLMQLNAELGRTSASIPPFELLGFLLSIAALLSLLAWLLVELTYGTPLAPITTDGFGRATRARGKGRWQQWFIFMFLLAGHTIKARRFVITGAQSGARYFLWLYGVQYISLIVLCVLDVGRPALFEGYQAVTHEDDEAVHLDDAQMAPIENVCPEQQSSLWSRMTFSWVTPLLKIGYKRALTPDDIFKVDRRDQTVTNVDKFNRLWRQEWVSKGQNASLVRVLLACFGREFAVGGLFKIGNDASQFVGPIALGGLLQFVNDRSQPDWVGYSYALLLLVGQVLGSLCEVQYFQRVMRVGMQVRAVLIAAGYRKSVCLGPQASTEFGSGKLANLLSNDTDSLKDCCQNLHTAWSSPLRIIVALGMLLSSLGPSALTAVVVIVAFIPVQARMAKLTAKFKKETAQFTDSRLKVSGELFGAMAIVKMYAWEIAFEGKVNSIRNDELVLLRRSSMFSAVNTFLINVNPVLVSLLTFGVYAVTEGDLTAEVAFTALSLFNILRMPMIMLPNVITSLTTAQVSVERLCALLVADEVDETSFSRGASSDMTRGPLISVSQASFSWDPREPQPTLRGIELEVSRGQVVVVIGTTGSGKSSLLSALLQELPCVTNQSESPVTMTGSIAYAAQQSWLFNASVRENIIFGLPYEPDRYYDAVRVAQLERDFELLPAADETEIGEKGSNLSGGQRQRISLARAAYARADIYLLDDPLSALDAKVGRLVFEQLVMGTLRSSAATIMVTNQLQYCSHADQVVVMKHGEIAESGPYEELLRNRGEFFELMREHGGHEDEDEDPSKREDDDQAKSLATKQTSASAKPPSVESQPAQSGKLMSAEGRSKGTVSVGVIMSYVAKAGGTTWFAFVSLTFVLVELLRALSTWWLGVWSSSGGSSIAYYMGIYALISIVMALCQLYNAISLVRGGLQAAKNFWGE
jgi:ATP-binding cassette subfamily C (CFTR/MRP) protein 1|eukprot:SAG25_NODE_554_length_6983_cov_2.661970_3_plen_1028_part_00